MSAEPSQVPDADVNVREESLPCYQCGICSGSCPAARLESTFNPRRMVVNSNLGKTKIPANNKSIWLCAGCFCCSHNCPNDVKVAEIVAELRVEAAEVGNLPLVIDEKKCIGCANCEYACPEDAIKVDPGTMVSKVDPSLCRSCGTCAVECPVFAISYANFDDSQYENMIMKTLEGLPEGDPKIIAFTCNWCGHTGAESSMAPHPNVGAVNMLCTGRIDPLFIYKAFRAGADGVLIAGCAPGRCFYKWNNKKAESRTKRIKRNLEELGIEPERMRIDLVEVNNGAVFSDSFDSFTEELKKLGGKK
ncbi:hydrogenase iron-sulfur subunit [archaeon]|nr:hydrogenase iron-sulfur subunit [archaeon]